MNSRRNILDEIRLDLVKNLGIKMSERNFTQPFDDAMSSFSCEERLKFENSIF